MSTSSLPQRITHLLTSFFFSKGRSPLFQAVQRDLDTHGYAYIDHPEFSRRADLRMSVRVIVGLDYRPGSGEEVYKVIDPHTHEEYELIETTANIPDAVLIDIDKFNKYNEPTITQHVDKCLAASYADTAMKLRRGTELLIGTLVTGERLSLDSGSRPCYSASLSDGKIINFYVLDPDTLKFKRLIHWDYTKGSLWGATLLPVAEGVLTQAHWLREPVSFGKFSDWVEGATVTIQQEHLFLKNLWGEVALAPYRYGELVCTPNFVGMVVGECTGEDQVPIMVVVEPTSEPCVSYRYRHYKPEQLSILPPTYPKLKERSKTP